MGVTLRQLVGVEGLSLYAIGGQRAYFAHQCMTTSGVRRSWRKWLSRRTRGIPVTWDKYALLFRRHPHVPPQIVRTWANIAELHLRNPLRQSHTAGSLRGKARWRRASSTRKIRVIQRRAYGLRDEEYLRLKVLTCMLPKF
jgi:hypothetical protein